MGLLWHRPVGQMTVSSGLAADALLELDDGDESLFKVSSVLYLFFFASDGNVTASGSDTLRFRNRRCRLGKTDNNDSHHTLQEEEEEEEEDIPVSPFGIQAAVVKAMDGPVA